MKKRTLICLLLIVLCGAVFFAYRAFSRMNDDHTIPTIQIDESFTDFSIQEDRAQLLQGVSAADETDGDVTASLLVEQVILTDSSGTAKVTYAAFDASGNVAKASRTIRYTDYVSPRFVLEQPLVFQQNKAFDILNIVQAQDLLDGNISHRIRATAINSTSITNPGVHQVEFRVTNSLGDTSCLVFPVEVLPYNSHQASLTLTDYLIYIRVGDSFTAESFLDRFTLGQESVSLNGKLPKGYTLHLNGNVNPAVPGVYPLGYTVTYKAASERDPEVYTEYEAYSKLIVVVEG